jgi:hypothetical protein
MIIAFRQQPTISIRLTFVQVKLDSKIYPKIASAMHPLFPTTLNLKANLEQHDLLARRPSIYPVNNTFKPAPDLLSGAILPSVGSFLFLRNPITSNFHDLNFHSADRIQIVGSPANKISNVRVRLKTNRNKSSAYHEVTDTTGSKKFAAALYLHMIGSPIHHEPNSKISNMDSDYRRRVRSWLLSSFTDLSVDNQTKPVLRNFLRLLRQNTEPRPGDQYIPTAKLPKNVLLLNTDNPPTEKN